MFSPLAGGWLTGKYRRGEPFPAGSRMTQRPGPYTAFVNDRTFDRLERLAEIARRRLDARWRGSRSPGCWPTIA